MKLRSLHFPVLLLLLAATQLAPAKTSWAQNVPDGCCVPIAISLYTILEFELSEFVCCCDTFPIPSCSEPIAISGGAAEYGGYSAIFACVDQETCEDFQRLYEEIENEHPGHPGNFPPIPCGELGVDARFTWREEASPPIWTGDDQICDACCPRQEHLDCWPEPTEEDKDAHRLYLCSCCE